MQMKEVLMEKYVYDSVLIGDNIMKLRNKKFFTREELSFRVHISVSHLAQIEQGSRKMSIELFVNLMNELSTDANGILGINTLEDNVSIDGMLRSVDEEKQKYFIEIFHEMITKAID